MENDEEKEKKGKRKISNQIAFLLLSLTTMYKAVFVEFSIYND